MAVTLNADGITGDNGSGLTMLGQTRWYVFGVGNSNVTSVTNRYEMFDTQSSGQQTFYFHFVFGRGGGQQQRGTWTGNMNLSSYPGGTGSWWYHEIAKASSGFTTLNWVKSGTKIYLDLRSGTAAIGSGHMFFWGLNGRIYPTFTGLTSTY